MSRVAVVTFVPALNVTRSQDNLTLNWPGTFTLQTATNVFGPYLDIPSATNGYNHVIDPADPQRFYRLGGPVVR